MDNNITSNTESTDPGTPNTMPTSFVQSLVDNYRNRQLTVINSSMNIDDAHSIWFDLPTLKKFVADIEAETQKIKPDATESDLGIRFHYAAYPRVENWDQMENQPIGQEYAGKHTLVMIPTLKMEKENGDYLHCDFNPLEASSYTKNDTAGRQSKVMAMGTLRPGPSSNTLAQNHGSLIPPNNITSELF